ncbi:MAG: hypothetical protein U0T77_10765 [Chitinophagales bacterium]
MIMLLAMCCHIIFSRTDTRPELNLYKVSSVNIESSWKNLTDKCTIKLPRKLKDFDKYKVREVFKRGDAVTVYLGYNGKLVKEFAGYITSVSADVPVVITCEDEMYKLKSVNVNFSNNNCYLPDLIKTIAPGYQYDVAEYNIGSVRFPKTTVAQVLQKLKNDYGLYSYFQNGKLTVGKIYSDQQKQVDINLEKIVSNNLNYKTKDDKRIKLTATSTKIKGDKIEVTIGDADGEERQLTYFNITSESDLKKLAQKDYDKYMADGFDGDIETFGLPFIQHGDKLNITSNIYSDRNGLYYCDGVTTNWQKSTYRRKSVVGQKVTE